MVTDTRTARSRPGSRRRPNERRPGSASGSASSREDPYHGSPQEPLSPVGEAQALILHPLHELTTLLRPAVAPHVEDIPEVRSHPGSILASIASLASLLSRISSFMPPPSAPTHHTDTPRASGHEELCFRARRPRLQQDGRLAVRPQDEPRQVAHVPVETPRPSQAVEVPLRSETA